MKTKRILLLLLLLPILITITSCQKRKDFEFNEATAKEIHNTGYDTTKNLVSAAGIPFDKDFYVLQEQNGEYYIYYQLSLGTLSRPGFPTKSLKIDIDTSYDELKMISICRLIHSYIGIMVYGNFKRNDGSFGSIYIIYSQVADTGGQSIIPGHEKEYDWELRKTSEIVLDDIEVIKANVDGTSDSASITDHVYDILGRKNNKPYFGRYDINFNPTEEIVGDEEGQFFVRCFILKTYDITTGPNDNQRCALVACNVDNLFGNISCETTNVRVYDFEKGIILKTDFKMDASYYIWNSFSSTTFTFLPFLMKIEQDKASIMCIDYMVKPFGLDEETISARYPDWADNELQVIEKRIERSKKKVIAEEPNPNLDTIYLPKSDQPYKIVFDTHLSAYLLASYDRKTETAIFAPMHMDYQFRGIGMFDLKDISTKIKMSEEEFNGPLFVVNRGIYVTSKAIYTIDF